jgi:hypothetical protein
MMVRAVPVVVRAGGGLGGGCEGDRAEQGGGHQAAEGRLARATGLFHFVKVCGVTPDSSERTRVSSTDPLK